MNNPAMRFKRDDGTVFPDWSSSEIGNVADTCSGGTPSTSVSEYWDGPIQWLTPTEINSKYVHNSKRTITSAGIASSSAKLLPIGALLLTTRATIGACSINNFDGDVSTNQGFQSLICKSSLFNEYAYYAITRDKFQKELIKHASGSTFLEISSKNLKKLPIPIPCLEEQQKIASFFSTLDQKISIYERKLESLEQLKKGLMQKIFNQEIRFKSKEGKDYPCWKIAKLSEISQSLSYGLNASAAQFDGKNGYLRITDIDERTNKYISSTRVSPSCNPDKKYLLKEGDIVFARTGNSVGKTYIYKNTDGVLYYAGFLIRARLNPDVYPYFIFLQTLTNKYRKWVRIMSQRSGQPGINSEEYGNYKIVLPCLEEQEKIASVFRELDKKIDLSLAKIASLKKLKQGFMQQMFV